jgi:hypothetical protein
VQRIRPDRFHPSRDAGDLAVGGEVHLQRQTKSGRGGEKDGEYEREAEFHDHGPDKEKEVIPFEEVYDGVMTQQPGSGFPRRLSAAEKLG